MAGDLIYAFRVMRLPLLDAGGAPIGRIEDIVAVPGRAGRRPASARIVGFVAGSQRRRIFVNANRVAELDSDGARLRSWDVDLNPFKPRAGRGPDRRRPDRSAVGDETVSDVGLRASTTAALAVVGDRQGPARQAQPPPPPAELPARRCRRGPRAVRPAQRDGGRGRPPA